VEEQLPTFMDLMKRRVFFSPNFQATRKLRHLILEMDLLPNQLTKNARRLCGQPKNARKA
jgi:hypothetical protein